MAVLRDIADLAKRAGVERLCLFTGHGGDISLLETVIRGMRMTHDMIAVQRSWFGFANYDGMFAPDALAVDIHRGASETSPMLACARQKVDMSKVRNFCPAMLDWAETWIGLSGQPAPPGWIIDDLNTNGACGDAAAATAEKSEALVSAAALNFAAFLSEFAGLDHRKQPGAGIS